MSNQFTLDELSKLLFAMSLMMSDPEFHYVTDNKGKEFADKLILKVHSLLDEAERSKINYSDNPPRG